MNWLVVEPTHLKNISQNGNIPQIGMKTKNIWNHNLDEPCIKIWFIIQLKEPFNMQRGRPWGSQVVTMDSKWITYNSLYTPED